MIIPVRCFTCGKVLADKWLGYERLCNERGTSSDPSVAEDAVHDKGQAGRKTVRGVILDELGITRGCCRTVMLTSVDLSTVI